MADYDRITDKQFVMTRENFSAGMDWIADCLSKEDANAHEVYVMQLLVEEFFQRMAKRAENPADFSMRLSWTKYFQRLKLYLTVKGEPYNPLLMQPEDTEEDLTGYAILDFHRRRLKYTRSRMKRENVIVIRLRESTHQEVRRILAGLVLGTVVGALLYVGAGPEFKQWLEDIIIEPIQEIFISALMMAIVPGNVISPFATNNIMQILFLACFNGWILSKMDGQLDWAREGVRFMSNFFMNVVQTVSLLLPFLVAISTVKMIMNIGLTGLLVYGRLLLLIGLGLPLSFLVAALLISLVGRLAPLPFLRKTVPFSALPFSSSNSSACLPATLKFCEEKLGMNERLTKFAVPVGMQFNMDGTAYYVSVISMMLACTFPVVMDADFLFSLFCVEFLMAMTGVGLLIMPPVLEGMGIPGTAVMHFIGIEPIMDMPGTAQNVVGNITSAFLVAEKEKQVKEEAYKAI